MPEERRPYLIAPRLEAIPGLVHGFGDAGWPEAAFLAFMASRNLRPVIMRQIHSDSIHRLDEAPARKLEGDALMANVPGLALVIRTADCLPVLLVDAKNRAVAAVHCGWRGTEKRILEKTVRAMGKAYASDPGELLAALGPCIGAVCYEVGPEVRESFLRAGFPPSVFTECEESGRAPEEQPSRAVPGFKGHIPSASGRPGKSSLDLQAANIWLLQGVGIKQGNIINTRAGCTHCEPTLLSYRRDPAEPRRMYNFIGLLAL